MEELRLFPGGEFAKLQRPLCPHRVPPLFSAFLYFQFVDVAVAIALTLVCARIATTAPLRRFASRHPVLLGTRARRCLLLELPLLALLVVTLLVVGRGFLFPAMDRLLHEAPRMGAIVNLRTFLLVGVAFWGGIAVVPVRAAWLALRDPVVADGSDRALAFVVLFAAGVVVVETCVCEPRKLEVVTTDVELPRWPRNRPALQVALVSDIQAARLTDHERRMVQVIGDLEPDLVLLAGDLVSPSLDEAQPLEQAHYVLDHLCAPLGVFVVNGDVDDSVEGGIRRVVGGTRAKLLENESVLLASNPPVELVGFDPRDEAGFARALAAPPRAAIRIALVHRPRYYAELGKAGFDLVLAGHTHGGQIVLPWFGPPVTLEIVPRDVAAGGLHRMEEGTLLYVTRGVGLEGSYAPPIRFLCPPEISELALGAARR
jgi:predicted MPP superfamily phosphohydrolase